MNKEELHTHHLQIAKSLAEYLNSKSTDVAFVAVDISEGDTLSAAVFGTWGETLNIYRFSGMVADFMTAPYDGECIQVYLGFDRETLVSDWLFENGYTHNYMKRAETGLAMSVHTR